MRQRQAGSAVTWPPTLDTVGAVDGREHLNPAMPAPPHLLSRQLRDLLPEGAGQAMSTPTRTDSIQADLVAEFTAARLDWIHAREHVAAKDTQPNRDAVEIAADEINAVLDMYLELGLDCE